MATMNPFDLLGDDDAEDPSQLIAAKQVAPPPLKKGSDHGLAKQAPAAPKHNKPANLPSKPLPPAQAVREAKNDGGRGGRGSRRGGGGRGYGRGRSSGGFNRDSASNDYSFSSPPEDGETGRTTERHGYGGPRGRGGRRGGFNNGEVADGEYPRGGFERHSGTGRGNEFKREGAGRGNWGRQNDEFSEVAEEVVNETEKKVGDEKPVHEDDTAGVNTENSAKESEEKEPEDKEMTLEEYEKLREEKRKALLALKTTEERKVDAKEFASMQQISSKKDNNDIFIKLGSDKDKRKEITDTERTKKSLSINEFLKPAEGERHYTPGGRGRGRGRGSRGGYVGSSMSSNVAAPSIEDPGQFPTLGGAK
ncbi:RGG repeats nuclear RNA binding protein A-like [Momordica charantia]|uniref:RGG repeats nuclear RNA binding protein A-like n=1 Tax=Momordica charantia TaxID=3673 RepID=A0A6J1DV55_MOMCH|nr:RGG repeats nuclear RNA binding protein A-like [Momordica charantia]